MLSTATVGERIALYRRRRGLGQAQLARLVGRTASWLEQVERGVRSVDRAAVLGQLAAVLRVPVGDLAPGSLVEQERDEEAPAVAAVRAALTAYPTLAKPVNGRPPSGRELIALRYAVDHAWELVSAARQSELAELLPGLLARAEAARAAWVRSDDRTSLTLAAETYQLTSALLSQACEPVLAWLAADRALVVAELSGDRLLTAASAFRLTEAFLTADRLEQALHVATATADALERRLENAAPELVSVWGALHLLAAVAAAGRQQREQALAHLDHAGTAARRVGEGRNDGHTGFGPAAVALHEVSVAVELGDPVRALRVATTVDTGPLAPEHLARLSIDVARAAAQHGRPDEAVTALLQAERLTPELVAASSRSREVVRELLATGSGAGIPELHPLAQRLGLMT